MATLLLNYQDRIRSHLGATALEARVLGSQKQVRGACETFEMGRKVRLNERHVKEYVMDTTGSEVFLAGNATGLEG